MSTNIIEPISHKIQFDRNGRLKHLLEIEGLVQDQIFDLLDKAASFIGKNGRIIHTPLLNQLSVINVFFEPSTRTRVSFELAAKKLSADVINFDAAQSSALKGETLLDTLKTIDAMQSDIFIIRHSETHVTHFLSQYVSPYASVINAGDGTHAHPTQALLDIFTIHKAKPHFSQLKVVLVGDIQHSRVARSLIQALKIVATGHIIAVGPSALLPKSIDGVEISNNFDQAIKGADVIVMLRLQKERMQDADIPDEKQYAQQYGLNKDRLSQAKSDAIVMHPGPINRGVEITSDVADGKQSLILQQVTHGVAIRMAVMTTLMQNR